MPMDLLLTTRSVSAELMEDEMDLPPVSDESGPTLQEGDVVQ